VLSVQTIRNYADNPANDVETRRTPGGHRLVCLSRIAELFGVDVTSEPVEEEQTGKVNVVYSRVSSRGQAAIDKGKGKTDSNLTRQAARLREFYRVNDVEGSKPLEISEQASGINSERRGLTKIIDLALAGRLGRLYIEAEDRLSRGSYALISRLLAKCGCEIIVTRTGERESTAKSAEEEIFADAMAMIFVGQAKVYGARSQRKYVFPLGFKERVAALYNGGGSKKAIILRIAAEGWKCQRSGRPIGDWGIRRVLREVAQECPRSVKRFIRSRCRVGGSLKVSTTELWAAFQAFAGEQPGISRRKLIDVLKTTVPHARLDRENHGEDFSLFGLTLKAV
jgi:predicted site-specific integrase-resolvase